MKNINRKVILYFASLFFLVFTFDRISSKEIEDTKNFSSLKKYELKDNTFTPYILDEGDVINIAFGGLDIFTKQHSVKQNGTITLPELGEVYVSGKTIEELKITLEDQYKKFIFNPEIHIELISPRQIDIYLYGEVKKPGLHTLKVAKNFVGDVVSFETPTVYNGLQSGLGLTRNADLSKVIIIRKNPESNGGGKLKTKIDLIKMLTYGDQSQNIKLHDGDSIYVSKTSTPIREQIVSINRANITPDQITIFVNGNVPRPGALNMKSNISLNEALAYAGGRKISSGYITFVRLDDYGSTTKSTINFNQKSAKGTKNNPYLIDGDIIYVHKNLIGKTSTILKEVGNPIINAYGIYNLFD